MFSRTQSLEEFEGQMLQRSLLKGFRGSLCDLMKNQGKVPRGNGSSTLWSVSVGTIQEMRTILILADINGRVSQFAHYG